MTLAPEEKEEVIGEQKGGEEVVKVEEDLAEDEGKAELEKAEGGEVKMDEQEGEAELEKAEGGEVKMDEQEGEMPTAIEDNTQEEVKKEEVVVEIGEGGNGESSVQSKGEEAGEQTAHERGSQDEVEKEQMEVGKGCEGEGRVEDEKGECSSQEGEKENDVELGGEQPSEQDVEGKMDT